MTALAIIDLGYGNVASIGTAFARLDIELSLTSDPKIVAEAKRVVLPGVGAAGYAMERLSEAGLVDVLRQRASPTLGICLGMQLLFEASEEGPTPCLGLLSGKVRAMAPGPGLPIPHMGWTKVDWVARGVGIAKGDYLYFAHSYACDDSSIASAYVNYGQVIPAAIRQGSLWGAQFHPERSSEAGSNFLKAFLGA